MVKMFHVEHLNQQLTSLVSMQNDAISPLEVSFLRFQRGILISRQEQVYGP
jgi:hypothetical protein